MSHTNPAHPSYPTRGYGDQRELVAACTDAVLHARGLPGAAFGEGADTAAAQLRVAEVLAVLGIVIEMEEDNADRRAWEADRGDSM